MHVCMYNIIADIMSEYLKEAASTADVMSEYLKEATRTADAE